MGSSPPPSWVVMFNLSSLPPVFLSLMLWRLSRGKLALRFSRPRLFLLNQVRIPCRLFFLRVAPICQEGIGVFPATNRWEARPLRGRAVRDDIQGQAIQGSSKPGEPPDLYHLLERSLRQPGRQFGGKHHRPGLPMPGRDKIAVG